MGRAILSDAPDSRLLVLPDRADGFALPSMPADSLNRAFDFNPYLAYTHIVSY